MTKRAVVNEDENLLRTVYMRIHDEQKRMYVISVYLEVKPHPFRWISFGVSLLTSVCRPM